MTIAPVAIANAAAVNHSMVVAKSWFSKFEAE